MGAALGLREAAHVVGGRRRTGNGAATVVLDAPDALPAFALAGATGADIDDAVDAATRAFAIWRRTPAPQRAAVLHRAADNLLAVADELAHVLVEETGKPLAHARGEVKRAAGALTDSAAHAATLSGRALTEQSALVWGLELREPRGPSLVVGAWNMPVQLAAIKAGAALAAGCSVVLKPSPLAPASAHFLHDALVGAGLAPGCLSIVQGGGDTAKALAAHPGIKVVSLTGCDETGREIMRVAADAPKKVILELGGKSANIVFADANIGRAVDGIVAGFVRNQGAACTAAGRVLVEVSAFDEVVSRVIEQIGAVVVGDPYADVEMGAIRHADLYRRLQDVLGDTARHGGDVTGGDPVAVPGRTGSFMRPAVVVEPYDDASILHDELFGPIATIAPFSGVDEAVRLANDSRYGLAAGLWAEDLATLEYVWEALDVGTVYVNSYHRIDGIPLATEGRGSSGFGVENGLLGVEEFRCVKAVHLPRGRPAAVHELRR